MGDKSSYILHATGTGRDASNVVVAWWSDDGLLVSTACVLYWMTNVLLTCLLGGKTPFPIPLHWAIVYVKSPSLQASLIKMGNFDTNYSSCQLSCLQWMPLFMWMVIHNHWSKFLTLWDFKDGTQSSTITLYLLLSLWNLHTPLPPEVLKMSGEQEKYESPPNGAYFNSYYDDAPFYLIPRDSPPDIYTDHQEVESSISLMFIMRVCVWYKPGPSPYFRMLWPP